MNQPETEGTNMQVPIHITMDDLPNADQLRGEIEKAAEALERFHDRIISCRVAVTTPDHRHRIGGLYDVHLTLRVPRHGDINISRRVGDKPERMHVGVAVREAFAEARRQLQDLVRDARLDVKTHVTPDHGRVARVFTDRDYGFIETPDGREIYFHRNSLVDAKFDQLVPGTEVRFVESEGDKGPQASTVKLIGKHHLH
jgi:cold shock CspA family protein